MSDELDLNTLKTRKEVLEWVNNNKQAILRDPKFFKIILQKLNNFFDKIDDTSELKKDVYAIIKMIKVEYEAIFKEYSLELTTARILEMANSDEMSEFFNFVKKQEKVAKFVDFFNIKFEPAEKLRYTQGYREEAFSKFEGPQNKPKTVDKLEDNKESNAEVLKIQNILKEHKEVNYFNLIIDPTSFSRTIYNAFNLSLAVRLKLATIKDFNNTIIVTEYVKGGVDDIEYAHSVLSLTPAEYRNLVDDHKITKRLL